MYVMDKLIRAGELIVTSLRNIAYRLETRLILAKMKQGKRKLES